MRLHILGTSAGKPVPRPFCSCRVCRHALKAGGRNRRTRTGVVFFPDEADGGDNQDQDGLVRPRYQVDLSPDWSHQLLRDRLDPHGLEHLLITHADADHCCPEYLSFRRTIRSDVTDLPLLNIYGNEAVKERVLGALKDLDANRCRFQLVEDGETFQAGQVRVTACRSTHRPKKGCLHYAVDDGSRQVLFAWDGTWPEDVWERLQARTFDAVLMECTWLNATGKEMHSHLDYDLVLRVKERMTAAGMLADGAPVITMHMGDNGDLTHEEAQARFAPHGVTVGYDGLSLQLAKS